MTAASRSLVSVFAARRVCLLRLQVHRSHLRSYSFLRTDHKVRNPLWHRVCSVSARQYRSEVAEMNRNNGSAYLQVRLCRGYELTELKSPLPGSRRVAAVRANLVNDVLRCSAWDWIQQMQCHLCCYSSITKGTPHLEHASACSSPLVPQIVCLDIMSNVAPCRYIFNAGEGFQRFCVQHKLKLNRMPNILVTRASLDAVGGIPGNACRFDQLLFNASDFQHSYDTPLMCDRHGFDGGRLFNFTSS